MGAPCAVAMYHLNSDVLQLHQLAWSLGGKLDSFQYSEAGLLPSAPTPLTAVDGVPAREGAPAATVGAASYLGAPLIC